MVSRAFEYRHAVKILRNLLSLNPPPNPHALEKLIQYLEEARRISLSTVLDNLIEAGYDGETIINILLRTRILTPEMVKEGVLVEKLRTYLLMRGARLSPPRKTS